MPRRPASSEARSSRSSGCQVEALRRTKMQICNIQYEVNEVGKTLRNHPFGNSLYKLFMVIWGMVITSNCRWQSMAVMLVSSPCSKSCPCPNSSRCHSSPCAICSVGILFARLVVLCLFFMLSLCVSCCSFGFCLCSSRFLFILLGPVHVLFALFWQFLSCPSFF